MERVKTEITYLKGDATRPTGTGQKIIVHICNNIGAWGAGFVLALSKRWKQPEAAYRMLTRYNLGEYHLVQVEDDIHVCNLIGQEGTISRKNPHHLLPPVRYVAIEKGLKGLTEYIGNYSHFRKEPITVHMPKIGSGLAGGNWKIIERIIEVTLCEAGIPVTVYEFN